MKTNLSALKDCLHDISLVICSSSFESRWFQITKSLDSTHLEQILILQRSLEEPAWGEGIDEIQSAHGNKHRIIDIDLLEPSAIWKKLISDVLPLIQRQEKLTLVDVTTLSHEAVVFFVSLIQLNGLSSKVKFAYAGASAYLTSNNEKDWWLSRGVKDIRSILGFPGIIRPSQSSHLMILVGFEVERAKQLILRYEPSSISLGIGVQPYSQEFLEKNNWYMKQIESFIETVGITVKQVSQFQFSCSDSQAAKESILEEANKFRCQNITVAPMNTKVSTIAAARAAIENDNLKLCYVEPLEYNKQYYSSPSDTVTLIDL